ncbi:hypothetical protein [uncultured Parabacteroides sp.]|uniref:hypothetical protein n=1 Tax=uncultured Parabacteroides sp. TaxID=512312 RepID=UPI0025E66E6D|nr:hypothetical protein [uncultured Parabacteroides sp.]
MKKVFLSMAALALVLASCSKEEVPGTNPDEVTNAVAIRIGQTVKGLETKAPVVNGSKVEATVLMHDASSSADWSKFSALYQNKVNNNTFDNDADRATVSTGTFTATTGSTGNTVTLAPALYYQVTGSDNSFLAAVAPKGSLEGQTVKMAKVDGEQDVMYAPTVDFGTKPGGGSATAFNLEFAHKTTQLIFKMKMIKSSGTGEWGGTATLKSISLVDAQLPEAVDFTDGTVSWTAAAPFAIPGTGNWTIGTTEAQAGNAVMVKAGGVKVNVEINGGGKTYTYNDVVVNKESTTTPLVAVEGKSHIITLSVTEPDKASSATEIKATATVTDWVAGDKGSADLK